MRRDRSSCNPHSPPWIERFGSAALPGRARRARRSLITGYLRPANQTDVPSTSAMTGRHRPTARNCHGNPFAANDLRAVRFRGVYPRGLIEAMRQSGGCEPSFEVSAGYTPAASLKHFITQVINHSLYGFRGVYPRGLIEAGRCQRPLYLGLRVSAGYTPAASLKPADWAVRRVSALRRFRGVYPRGLIEATTTPRRTSGRSRRGFRGVYPRGLIEAPPAGISTPAAG